MTEQQHESSDPCADFGPTQRWAAVWTVAVIAIGSLLTFILCRIDNHMYQTNGEFLDYSSYRENRHAIYSIPTGVTDTRAVGDLVATEERAGISKN